MAEAFIFDHVRSPRGRGKPDGALHEVTALNLCRHLPLPVVRRLLGLRVSPAGVIGTLALLVAFTGTSVAATGGNLILGRSNTATSMTTLSNANGTALKVSSRAGTPRNSCGPG